MISETVLVTGANRGIGLAFVRHFLSLKDSSDISVVAACRDPEAAEQLKELAQVHPNNLALARLDVSDPGSVEAFARGLAHRDISLLINNAGVYLRENDGLLVPEDMLRQFAVNALGPLLVTRALLPRFKGSSKIVNITSRMGSIGDNTSGGSYGYRASKAALNMATKNLAIELQDRKICVLGLHPGYVRTGMTGGNGDIDAEEAVSKMAATIAGAGMEKTGSFLHRDGYSLPW